MNIKFTWEIRPYKIQDVIELIKNKRLILRPEYQRRSVWSKPAKAALIETIIQKKPIPLFLIHKKDTGVLEVIDGQQRLRSILDFSSNQLKLTNVDDNINGKTYSDFSPNLFPEYDYQKIFNNYELYFNLVENANEDDIIDMYSRVNKYTVNLNKMEMRYSLNHDTNIMKFIEELTEDEKIFEFFLNSNIFSQTNVNRMGDIEFFTLLLSYILEKSFMNKDEDIVEFFSKYANIDNKELDSLKKELIDTLTIIKNIFHGSEFQDYFDLKEDKEPEYYLKNTRFSQKNDFLSLFCTLNNLKTVINFSKLSQNQLSEIRNFLIFMDGEIAPQSDIKITSEYGIKCVSQANTKASREFRSKFILEGFNYIFKNDYYRIFNFSNDSTLKEVRRLDLMKRLFKEVNELYDTKSNLSLENNSTFKNILDFLWEEEDA